MRKPGLPVISLFSGAMGLDLGLEQAGIWPTLAIEQDELCCATIQKNRPDHDVWQADISQLDSKAILARHKNPNEVFLMVGGPPCPMLHARAFARAGSVRHFLTHEAT